MAVVLQRKVTSANAHLKKQDDILVSVDPMLALIKSWRRYLNSTADNELHEKIQAHTRTGRPAGNRRFFEKLEQATGIDYRPKKAGRKPRGTK